MRKLSPPTRLKMTRRRLARWSRTASTSRGDTPSSAPRGRAMFGSTPSSRSSSRSVTSGRSARNLVAYAHKPGWVRASSATTYRFTVKDYHRMAEADVFEPDDRVELVDGEVFEMAPIGSRHAECVT